MHPMVGSIPANVVGWGIAAVLGGGSLVWLSWRAGMRVWQIAVTIVVMALSLFVGSKLLYLFEAGSEWPKDPEAFWLMLVSAQMRIPGGFLLTILVGPPLARLLRVRYGWFADILAPCPGLFIVGIRIGCFLEGCCYGRPSSLPWAVVFPGATEAVHPLQLYFAAVGLLMFLGLAWYQRHKRYDGEVLLLFALIFLWSTWALELLRGGYTHDYTRTLVLATSVAITAVVPLIELRIWVVRRRERQRRELAFAR
jgi:phosphatidylglycerol:prolipoprotein diacylglycerol transferase